MCINSSARHLFVMIAFMIGPVASSSTTVDPVSATLKPARGWILVRNGSEADVKAAIVDYDALVRRKGRTYRVELHPQSGGGVAVLLPDGFPAYDLANMTGWLNAPPEQESVHDAVSWITSPGDGVKYYLQPEIENARGDTLIGASVEGRSIRVYLPEAGISELSLRLSYQSEPDIEISQSPIKIQVTRSVNSDFGNPDFIINSAKDYGWGWWEGKW